MTPPSPTATSNDPKKSSSLLDDFHTGYFSLMGSFSVIVLFFAVIFYATSYNILKKNPTKIDIQLLKEISAQMIGGSFYFIFLSLIGLVVSIHISLNPQQKSTTPPTRNSAVFALYLFLQVVALLSFLILWSLYIKCKVDLKKSKAKDPEKTKKQQKKYKNALVALFFVMPFLMILLRYV